MNFRASIRQSDDGKYRASITNDGARASLGSYADPVRAALAVLRATTEQMGLAAMTGKLSAMLCGPSLVSFLRDQCHYAPGEAIKFSQFYDQFLLYLPSDHRAKWSKQRVIDSLPSEFPYGISTNNQRKIGNVSWTPPTVRSMEIYRASSGRLTKRPA